MRRSAFILAALTVALTLPAASSALAWGRGGPPLSNLLDTGGPIASPVPRQTVSYDGPYAPGTIIVSTKERRLYFVLPDHQALKYGVGVGRPGFTWAGVTYIANKREWPDWTPPAPMLLRRPDLPRHMEGGIENPLGARAMYLAGTLVPHPRLQRARHDRPGGVLGLHPHDQRRRDRPLRARQRSAPRSSSSS